MSKIYLSTNNWFAHLKRFLSVINLSRRVLSYLLFCNLLGNLACTILVTDQFPEYDKIPTVNAILRKGDPLVVQLSWTGGLDSLPLETINDATIKLFVEGEFTEQLAFDSCGIYSSNALIESEKVYKCQVVIPGEDTIVCSQTLPDPNPILKVEHINIAGRDEEGGIYHAFKVTFRNNPTVKQYFEVESGAGSLVAFTDPVLRSEGLSIALFSNECIEDSVYTLTINYSSGYYHYQNGKRVLEPYTVELRSLTFDYYDYQRQYYRYSNGKYGDISVSTNAISLYSNIDNGYGIFAGYSTFVSDTINPEPYVED